MEETLKRRPEFIPLERGEKIAGWIYLPFFFVLVELALAFAFMAVGRDIYVPRNQMYLILLRGGIHLCVLAVIFRKYLRKNLRQTEEFPGRFFIAVAIGLGIYVLGNLLVSGLLTWIDPEFENVNDNNIIEMAEYGPALIVLYAVFLAPPTEELVFRGLIFSAIRPRSRFWAYAVSIVTFSLMHVVGYMGMYPMRTLALAFVEYLPAAFGLAYTKEYSGSIWASICVHMLVNAIGMRAYGIG